mmetsp:Transcript_63264/g.176017  ORF Transcript_63264/g.176017 Transcript_63264/m.176017 type:complete len:327 (+) Transcript_63264:329-1309(+)
MASCSGVHRPPSRNWLRTFARALRSNPATLTASNWTATWSGVCPWKPPLAFGSARLSSSISTIPLKLSAWAATCKEVRPSSIGRSTAARCSKSRDTRPACPCFTARCSGAVPATAPSPPAETTVSTEAPSSMSFSAVAWFPLSTATCRGARPSRALLCTDAWDLTSMSTTAALAKRAATSSGTAQVERSSAVARADRAKRSLTTSSVPYSAAACSAVAFPSPGSVLARASSNAATTTTDPNLAAQWRVETRAQPSTLALLVVPGSSSQALRRSSRTATSPLSHCTASSSGVGPGPECGPPARPAEPGRTPSSKRNLATSRRPFWAA